MHGSFHDFIFGGGGNVFPEFLLKCIVDFALLGTHFAVQHHFSFFGQLFGDLFFGSAQDERAYLSLQVLCTVLVLEFVDGHCIGIAEICAGAQQSGAGKRQLCVEVESIVFQGGAGKQYLIS